MNNPTPYQFVAIEGNIGAGKTTLTNRISTEWGCQTILEQFTDNPFLPLFYKQPERYAFPVELFFMTERHKQLQEILTQQSLFQPLVLADYFFIKTLLFARNNLLEEEYRLFQRLFDVLNASFPKPGLLVYIHRPINALLKNISKRGRSYETDISREYLQSLQEAYLEYFRTDTSFPIVVVEAADIDFFTDDDAYQSLLNVLKNKYHEKT